MKEMSLTKKTGFQIPAKLYRIGELVRYTPFSRQTLHNYTVMGLIREAQWTEGGHRLYDETVFEKLQRIMELRETRTLWEIREIFNTEQKSKRRPDRNAGNNRQTPGFFNNQIQR